MRHIELKKDPPLFRAYIPGMRVKPTVRQTQRSKYVNKEAIAYNKNQHELAQELTKASYLWMDIVKSLYKEKIKFPIEGPMIISYTAAYTGKHLRDDNNVRKAVEDALVKAGVISDDDCVILPGADRTRTRIGAKENYLVVELRRDVGKKGDLL